jgi:ABC-type xylose transport system permease subunit
MGLGTNLQVALQGSALEGGGPTIPCKVASVVWQDAQRRFQRYSTLVYVLAVLAVIAILGAVAFFLLADDATGEGLVTLVSGLIAGGLATFIKDERDKAREDRDAAVTIVKDQCAGQTADQVVAFMGL